MEVERGRRRGTRYSRRIETDAAPMTSPEPVCSTERLRLSLKRFFLILLYVAIALYPVAVTWRGVEAYYLSNHRQQIDAEIISVGRYKNTFSGEIHFQYPIGSLKVDCFVVAHLGNQSNYLKFKPNHVIKIVPRSGCDDPVISTHAELPVFEFLSSIAVAIVAFFSVKPMFRREHRRSATGRARAGKRCPASTHGRS